MIDRDDAVKVADAILEAYGSGLRHLRHETRERVIAASREALDEFLSKIARQG